MELRQKAVRRHSVALPPITALKPVDLRLSVAALLDKGRLSAFDNVECCFRGSIRGRRWRSATFFQACDQHCGAAQSYRMRQQRKKEETE
jgi:hypothetical protein